MQPPQGTSFCRRDAVAVALLLLLAVGLVAVLWPDGASPGLPAASPAAPAPVRELRAQQPTDATSRRGVGVEPELTEADRLLPAPEADLSHPYTFSLEVHVRGGLGTPVAGASVFVAPPECGFARWPSPTGTRGDVRLSWRGRQRVMTVTVAVLVDGVLQPARQVQVEHGVSSLAAFGARARRRDDESAAAAAARSPEELRRDAARVGSARAAIGQGRLRQVDELDALCGRKMLLFEEFSCVRCHEAGRVRGYRGLASCGEMTDDLHPDACFEDLGARGGRGLGGEQGGRAKRLAGSSWPRAAVAARGGYVVGVARGGDGAPAGGVSISSLTAEGGLELTARSERDGRFRLGPFGTREVEVMAASGPLGVARSHVQVVEGQDTAWSPSLAPYQTVAGRVLDPRGAPLAGWLVELRRDEGDWAAVVETARDGSFAMHGVPGTVLMFAWPRHAALGVPLLYGKSAMVGARDVVLALHPDSPTRARLRVHVELPHGMSATGPDVRAVHLGTGAVARLAPLGHEDAFEAAPLPPGVYQVQIGAALAGWVTTSEVAVDGRGLWDLGRVALPAPGRVRLRYARGFAPLAEGSFRFYRRTPTCDVRSAQRSIGDHYELPPGEHALAWRSADGIRAVSFEVESGETTEVTIAPRR